MDEVEIGQKFDEVLMFIFSGEVSAGRNTFANTVNLAIDQKLDNVIEILEKNGAASLTDEIRALKNT